MITAGQLSDKHKPEALLPKEKTIASNQEFVPKDIAAIEEYLEEFIKKLQKNPLIKDPEPILTQSTTSKPEQNNTSQLLDLEPHSITRLKKVGAKSFAPRNYEQDNTDQTRSFIWDNFKQEQKRSIEKLATQTSPEKVNTYIEQKLGTMDVSSKDVSSKQEQEDPVVNQINKQKISKFGVYGGWHWEDNPTQAHKFYLVNNISKQKITVCYKEEQGLVDLTTSRKNMMDDNLVAIMIEITRNIQRYSNNHQAVNTIGLEQEYDKEIINKLTQHTTALNAGVKLAKNTADQNKLFKINLPNSHGDK
jgi:hypothetical protein